jgi:hypothetical protein
LHWRAWSRFNTRFEYTWFVNQQWAGSGQNLELPPGFQNNSAVYCQIEYQHVWNGYVRKTDTVYAVIMSAPFAIRSNYTVHFTTDLAPNTAQYSKQHAWNAGISEDVILRLFPGQIWSVDFSTLVGGHQLQYRWQLFAKGVESPSGFSTAYIQATFNTALNGSTYQLTVSNPAGFVLLPRIIAILAIPEPIDMPTDIYVVAGEEVQLQARFHPETTPSILYWELNGEQISVNSTNFNMKAGLDLDQAQLTLVATNLAGTSRTAVTLHVQGNVQISPWVLVAIGGGAFALVVIGVLALLIYKGTIKFPKKESLPKYEMTPAPNIDGSTEGPSEAGQFDFGNDSSDTVGIPLDDEDQNNAIADQQ